MKMSRAGYLFALKASYFVIETGIFTMFWLLSQPQHALTALSTCVLVFMYAFLVICIERLYGGWQIGLKRIPDIVSSQLLALVITNIVVFMAQCLILNSVPRVIFNIQSLIAQGTFAIIWCMFANQLYFKHNPSIKIIVLYENEMDLEAIREIHVRKTHFNVVDTIKVCPDWCLADVTPKLTGMEAVLLTSSISSPLRNDILKYCYQEDITVYVRPKIGDVMLQRADTLQTFHVPIMYCGGNTNNVAYKAIKRASDILVSLLGLIVLSPLFLLISLAIKLDDGGHIFYLQDRFTRDRKIFKIIKFRSMQEEAEKDGKPQLAAENDQRITKVGRILRRCRMDELPQLVNILLGDMALVGPRPERPDLVEEIEAALPEFRLRLKVKAGLTGYAQVHGKYNTQPYDKLEMDLIYISRPSLFEDVKLVLQTVRILFVRESTEGVKVDTAAVADGEKTADIKADQGWDVETTADTKTGKSA